jgi:hypothetical protein
LRFKVATGEGDAFPPADANGRNDFIIKTIKEAANKYGGALEPKLTSVLSRVMKDVDVFDDLITFVCVSLVRVLPNYNIDLILIFRPGMAKAHC